MLMAILDEYGDDPGCVAPRASAENDSGAPYDPGWKPEWGFEEGDALGGVLMKRQYQC